MSDDQLLKAVIDKYELSEPVPGDVRLFMEKSRKKSLVMILQKDSRNALFVSAVVSFFLWVKKFGISLSFAKSAAVVTAALIIGAGAITAGGVYTAAGIMHYITENDNNSGIVQNIKTESDNKSDLAGSQGIMSFAVAVSPVEMADVSDRRLSEYTEMIIRELRRIKGERAAIILDKLDDTHKTGKILSIAIIKLDEKSGDAGTDSIFRLSAKIINTSNSRVLTYVSITADNESALNESLCKLAEKISDKI